MKLFYTIRKNFAGILAGAMILSALGLVIPLTAQTPPSGNMQILTTYDGNPSTNVFAQKGSIVADASSNKLWVKVGASGNDGDWRALNLNTVGNVVTGTVVLVSGSATVTNAVFSTTSRGFTSVAVTTPNVTIANSFSGTVMTIVSGTTTDTRVVTYGVFHTQ